MSRTPIEDRIRRLRRTNGYSVARLGKMHGIRQDEIRRILNEDRDPLSQQIDRKYAACMARGGHRLSERTIVRDWFGEDREFRICASCTVPISNKRATGWLGNIVDVKSRWHDGKPAKDAA